MIKWLFLHYGPGGNAEIEKSIFSDVECIDFWNQPPCSSKKELVQATKNKLTECFGTHGDLFVVGHSFGCDLLLESLSEAQALKTTAILLSPVPNIFLGFSYLAKKILLSSTLSKQQRSPLNQAVAEFEQTQTAAKFWDLFQLVVQEEDFFKVYWKSTPALTQYQKIQAQTPPLRFNEWTSVLNQEFSLQKINSSLRFKKIIVVQGLYDPYLNGEDVSFWKQLWPNVELLLLETGHYPHIENTTALRNILTKHLPVRSECFESSASY